MAADLLEFVVKIKDLTSMAANKMSSNIIKGFGGMEAAQSRFQSKVHTTTRSVSQLSTQLDHLTKKRDLSINVSDVARANREILAVERRMHRLQNVGVNRSGETGLRVPTFMKAAAIGAGLLMGGQYIAKAGANAQKDLIGLTTFLGKDKANSVYAQLQKDAKETPFGTKALLSVDRALIGAGVSADVARNDMLALANAVSAVGAGDDELMRMAENMRQIKTKGHAELEDIKQFGNVGISIFQLLADATGKTLKQTSNMVVTYDLLSFALRKAKEDGGLYAHAMENQGKSIWGKWSSFLDNIEIGAAKVGLSQSNAITGLIDQLIAVTDRIPQLAEQWAPAIGSMVEGVIGLTKHLINMAKWVYHNWHWLKYAVGVMVAFRVAVWAATAATQIYNTVMTVMAMRAVTMTAATTAATGATVGLSAALNTIPWVRIATMIAGVGLAITALVSDSKNAGENIAKNLDPGGSKKLPVGAKGEGFKSPLGGGEFVQDTSTFSYATVLKNIHDTVGSRVKVFTGNKLLWVPKADTIDQNPALSHLLKNAKSFTGVAGADFSNKVTTSGNDLYKEKIEEKGRSIIGGGSKVVNISFRNVVEHMKVEGATIDAQAADWEYKVKIAMWRIMQGLPA